MLVAHTMLIFNSSNNVNYNDARVKECYLEVHKENETNYSNTGYYCTYIVLTPLCMQPLVLFEHGWQSSGRGTNSDFSKKTAFQLVGSNKTDCSNWKRQILLSTCILRGSREFMSIAGHGSGDIASPRTLFSHFHTVTHMFTVHVNPCTRGLKLVLLCLNLVQLNMVKHALEYQMPSWKNTICELSHINSTSDFCTSMNRHKNLLLFLILSSGHYVRTYSWEMDRSQ